MAVAYITEYAVKARDAAGYLVEAGQEPFVAKQKITYTTAVASAAFNASTRFVLITTDGDKAHLAFAAAPTATADFPVQLANTMVFYGVIPGQKVSFYDGTS